MKSIILGLLLVLGFASCEPELCEDCYTYTYSDGTTEWVCVEYDCDTYDYSLSVDTFTGVYDNYETLVDGVPYAHEYPRIIEFSNGVMFFKEVVEGNVNTTFSSPITFDESILYVRIANTNPAIDAEYPYTVESNEELTLTSISGDYIITYKLRR